MGVPWSRGDSPARAIPAKWPSCTPHSALSCGPGPPGKHALQPGLSNIAKQAPAEPCTQQCQVPPSGPPRSPSPGPHPPLPALPSVTVSSVRLVPRPLLMSPLSPSLCPPTALSIFSALEPARSSPLPSLLPVTSAWKALPPAYSSPVIWVILTPPGASGTPPLAPLIECKAHTTSDSSASMACDLSLPNPQHTCGALLYACLPWSVPVHQSIPRAQHRVWHIAENQYLFTELKRAA